MKSWQGFDRCTAVLVSKALVVSLYAAKSDCFFCILRRDGGGSDTVGATGGSRHGIRAFSAVRG